MDKGIKDKGELDETSGDDGKWRGGSSISRAASHSIRSRSMSSSPKCVSSSPSAAVQGAELHSVHSLLSRGGHCRGSRSWSDGLGSTSGLITRSVARLSAGSQIAAGNGSQSSVGSGWCSAPRGDGGLGSGSGVDLARASSGETVRGDPFFTRVHSTKAAKSSRGPSSDDSALLVVFRLAL